MPTLTNLSRPAVLPPAQPKAPTDRAGMAARVISLRGEIKAMDDLHEAAVGKIEQEIDLILSALLLKTQEDFDALKALDASRGDRGYR